MTDPHQIQPLRVEGFGQVSWPEGLTQEDVDRLIREAEAERALNSKE